MTIPAVVIDLLLVALPADSKRLAAALAAQVLARPNVAPHAGKLWGDVSDVEGNAIAHECGLLARQVIAQTRARDRRSSRSSAARSSRTRRT